jgi:hypothetical protein
MCAHVCPLGEPEGRGLVPADAHRVPHGEHAGGEDGPLPGVHRVHVSMHVPLNPTPPRSPHGYTLLPAPCAMLEHRFASFPCVREGKLFRVIYTVLRRGLLCSYPDACPVGIHRSRVCSAVRRWQARGPGGEDSRGLRTVRTQLQPCAARPHRAPEIRECRSGTLPGRYELG